MPSALAPPGGPAAPAPVAAMPRERRRRTLALCCAAAGLAVLGSALLWFLTTARTPPAVLPPAGEALRGSVPFRFAVLGDSRGRTGIFARLLDRLRADQPSLILHTGDLVRHADEAEYDWFLARLRRSCPPAPFCAVAGNHDINKGERDLDAAYRDYSRAFGPRHYWFSYADVLFVALDTATGVCTAEEIAWLDQTLALRRGAYAACFVFTHYPPRDPRPERPHALSEGAEALGAVLRKHRVTALLAGHIHGYLEDKLDGLPVLITGGAGAHLDSWFRPDHRHHYVLCTVGPGGAFQWERIDIDERQDRELLEHRLRANFPPVTAVAAGATLLLAALVLLWRAQREPRATPPAAGAASPGERGPT